MIKGQNTFNRSSSSRNWAPHRRNPRIPHEALAPLRCNKTAGRGKETRFLWWKDFYSIKEEEITTAESKRWLKKGKKEVQKKIPPPPFEGGFEMGKERFGEARERRVCISER